jgi:SAM-dependent methyltransferase
MSRLVLNLWNDVRFRRRPPGLFQNRSATALNRYPLIFSYVQRAVGVATPIRILSFGCATGEEVETLRRYFPAATIKGIDVNPFNIATCQRRLARTPDPRIAFEVADSARAEPAASYDIVFCLAVLRRSGLRGRDTCLPDIAFAQFDRCVGELARSLRPGGLLALRHTSFRFADTAAAREFEVVLTRPPSGRPPVLFGPDNRRLRHGAEEGLVFRKRAS